MKDLFIVARNERALYDYLTQHFAGRQDVEVILDRRTHAREGMMADDRRRLRSVQLELTALGFSIVAIPESARARGE